MAAWLILLALASVSFLVAPPIVSAQTAIDLPEEKIRCLRTELTEVGFTQAEIDDLFSGKIADPESFVEGRIGEDGIRKIGETCFPEYTPEPTPGGPTPTPEITITPEQRACVTKYLPEDLLDQMLRGEVRPEDVLTPEQMQTIGQDCFAYETPPPSEEPAPVPHTIDLPPDVIECLKREVGEQAVREVSSGQRSPTPEEYAKGEKCFEGHTPGGGPGSVPDFPEATKQCIRGIIGDKFDRAMELARSGGRPESLLTPEEMQKVGETCFGGAPGGHTGGPPGAGGPPPEMIACVKGIVGEARLQEFMRGSQPTPEEIRKIEAADCFPKGAGPGPGGPGSPVPELPPGVRACLEGKFGPGRVAEILAGRSQPTPEEIQRAQECFGGPGTGVPSEPKLPPGGTDECVTQCTTYQRPDGSKFSEAECRQMCQGGPGPGPGPEPTGPPPEPTGPPGGFDQCVEQCRTYEGGRYNVGDFCERACRGEPVQLPGGEPTPYPSAEPPPTSEPTPAPTPDTGQCVAGCIGYPKGDGTTYTESECQALCSGGQVGGVETTREALEAPWPVRFLLRLLGF